MPVNTHPADRFRDAASNITSALTTSTAPESCADLATATFC